MKLKYEDIKEGQYVKWKGKAAKTFYVFSSAFMHKCFGHKDPIVRLQLVCDFDSIFYHDVRIHELEPITSEEELLLLTLANL